MKTPRRCRRPYVRKSRRVVPQVTILDDRVCPSAFYDLDLIALTAGESTLRFPSVNDAGEVTINRRVGQSTEPDNGVYFYDGSKASQVSWWGIAGTQLNDRRELLASGGLTSGGEGGTGAFEIDSGSFRIMIRPEDLVDPEEAGPDDLSSFTGVSLNNLGDIAFVGLNRYRIDESTWRERYFLYRKGAFDAEPTRLGQLEYDMYLNTSMSHASTVIADDGSILVSVPYTVYGTQIYHYQPGTGLTPFAAPADGVWLNVKDAGRMSDDGSVIIFSGNRGNGFGVFASIAQPDGTRVLTTVIGESDSNGDGIVNGADQPNPELGYDAKGMPIYFDFDNSSNFLFAQAFPFVTTFQRAGGTANAIDPGESFLVQFNAKPSQASRLNPITGTPLLFTANEGLWSTLVRVENPTTGAGPVEFLRSSAHPIVQVGDSIAGHKISRFSSFGGVSTALRDSTGVARTVTPGDHHVSFTALVDNFTSTIVIRASQLDSDGDGLYDHWETEGIDIDRDGSVDLDLPAMGANPLRQDLFLEVDWIADDVPAGNPGAFRSFEPLPAALDFLVDTFAKAPITNPDGSKGITVHLDAGAYFNKNMGNDPALLGGGDAYTDPSGKHIHVLYFGAEGSVSFPGQTDTLGRPIVARSVEAIKSEFFGTGDKWARELAFRYVLFGDHQSAPTNFSSGLGELTSFNKTSFHTIPGNDFLVTLQGKIDPPTLSVPGGGPPATIATPAAFLHGQTLIHELGHTLGLRHGGVDHITTNPPNWANHYAPWYKPTYRSVMNYAYQFGAETDGNVIRTYSDASDPIFNDWANIQLNFNRYFDNLGNTLGIAARGGELPPGADTPEPDMNVFFEVNNPANPSVPIVSIDWPANPTVTVGNPLIVPVTARDDIAVVQVSVEFDADGDGEIDVIAERFSAVQTGADTYEATIPLVTGPAGTRIVTVTATDGDDNATTKTATISVADSAAPKPPTLVGYREFGVGSDGTVKAYNPDGTVRFTLTPFPGQPGSIRTAAGDFNGDGIADLVVGTGPGGPTHVKVFNGATQAELFSVDPFEAAFTGGVYVTAGDLDGDGVADLVITPDEGGGPRVRAFTGNGFGQIADFFGIDDKAFRGGARSAVGDLNGDGTGDLVVVAGFGGGPRVAAFDGAQLQSKGGPKLFNDFFAFEQALRNGIFVAAGDVNGDGFADLVAGGGPGGGPRVYILNGRSLVQNGSSTLVPLGNFFAGDPAGRGGVRVAVKNLDNDEKADVVTGAGIGAGSRVTAYLGKNISPIGGTPSAFLDFDAFAGFGGGVFVG